MIKKYSLNLKIDQKLTLNLKFDEREKKKKEKKATSRVLLRKLKNGMISKMIFTIKWYPVIIEECNGHGTSLEKLKKLLKAIGCLKI